MKKEYLAIGVTLGMFALTGAALAAQPERLAMILSKPGTDKQLVLPAAAEHSKVISLGEAVDPQTGETVEGFAIIHRGGAAKPDGVGGGKKPPKEETSSCYAFMAREAKWRSLEPWYVNPANSSGLDPAWVFSRVEGDIGKWEDAADGSMDGSLVDVLGEGAPVSVPLEADTVSPDGLNEVYFGSIEEPGVIAVTIVWGVFGGPPPGRYLAEWDMVFDQADFGWSATGESDKMDFENISTHELGHSVGLGHPDASCIEETMYAYASFGETIKRDLNAGDIAGMSSLY